MQTFLLAGNNIVHFNKSLSKQNVKRNHGFVEIGLEGFVPSFFQPVITQIAFETLDHPLHRWPSFHDGLEPL